MAQARTGQVTRVGYLRWWVVAATLLAIWTSGGSVASLRAQEWRARTATAERPATANRTTSHRLDLLWSDAADGYLDRTSFLAAALFASGVESAEQVTALERRFLRWTDQQSTKLASVDAPTERARLLLKALHRDWLTGQYYAACSRVDQSLTAGNFNCVTATALFHVAAGRLGLPDEIISVPGHVYNRLSLTPPLDVQTTSPTWLDPGAIRPPVPTGPERRLTEVQLIGKLFYNRGVALLSQQRFDEATEAFQRALLWDPQDRSASQNLLAALNNGALAAADRGQYSRAVAMLERGLNFDPHFAPLVANYQHVTGQWVEELLQTNRYHDARRVVEAAAQRLPHHDTWLVAQQRAIARWDNRRRTTVTPPDNDWWSADAHLTTAAP